MADLVVCVKETHWREWLKAGDHAGDPWSGRLHGFKLPPVPTPNAKPGDRVYVMMNGIVRGYAPLVRIERLDWGIALIRGGGAQAVTPMCLYPGRCPAGGPAHSPHPAVWDGFAGVRERWWDRLTEWRWPNWRTER